ncbi:MAG: sulfatase [Armatimonadota bacterium]|nr:MAG: sulfatase [Armatimonadota bacterium]
MNVLLLDIDTLRADHLGCYGYARKTSPNLDALAAQGALCEKLYAPAVPTQPSHTTMYTGQYPITHGIVSHGGAASLADDAPFLPELLQKAGYTTCAVDTMRAMKPWFARGYEFYVDPSAGLEHRHAATCERVNARAIPWLRQHADERFFLYVHYWEPHTPYLPPARYRGLFYDGDPTDPKHDTLAAIYRQPFGEWWLESWFSQFPQPLRDAEYIVAMYDGEIRYADDGVGELLAALDDTADADDTLVLVFSDHGENMYHHDVFFDHHGLYEGVIHCPLVVRWPGRVAAGTRVPHLVQHTDLAPTLLDAAGVEIPQAIEGRSLVPLITAESHAPLHDRLITQECTWQAKWALRTDEYKLILSREQGRDLHDKPPRELYHLAADPGELTNLAERQPDVVAAMESELEQWIARMMEKNGLEQDPLIAQGITLGKRWRSWVKEKGYW